MIDLIKEELKKSDLSEKSLRKFGFTISVPFLIIAVWLYFSHAIYYIFFAGLAAVFILMSVFSPSALRQVYIVWMGIAFILGYIMTRIILTILFYLVMMPIGIILRLTGKDLLKLKISGEEKTYWEKRTITKKTPSDYEKQF